MKSDVYRSRWEAGYSAITGVVIAAVLVPHAVVEHTGFPPIKLVELVVAAAIAVVAHRFYVAGAYVDEEGVTIMNPFQRMRLQWREVSCFSVGRYGRWPAAAFVQGADGRRIPIIAIRAAGRRSAARVETLVAHLNRVADRRKGLGDA